MNEDIKPLQEAWAKTQSLLIITPGNSSLDAWAASLGLYLAIQESGKSTIVASSGQPLVAQANLVGIDQVTSKLGNRNLVISFDYIQDSIEKVSYNVEGKKFNLVIQPKEGTKPLDPTSVNYNYEGSDAQIVFVVAAKTLAELGDLYLTGKKVFDQSLLVNLDNQTGNSKYGQVNLVEPLAISLSGLVLNLIQTLGLPLSPDTANNLWQGLEAATQKFQHPNLTADTFEAAATLIRAGAKRSAPLSPPPAVKPFIPTETPISPSSDWLKPPKIYRGSDEV